MAGSIGSSKPAVSKFFEAPNAHGSDIGIRHASLSAICMGRAQPQNLRFLHALRRKQGITPPSYGPHIGGGLRSSRNDRPALEWSGSELVDLPAAIDPSKTRKAVPPIPQ